MGSITGNDEDEHIPTYWVDQTFVVVQDHEVLPQRCVRTNAPVSPEDMVTRTVYYVPFLVYVLAPFALLPVVILIMIIRKPARVTFGISPEVRRRTRIAKIISALALLSGIASFVTAALVDTNSDASVPFVIAGIVLVLGGLIGFIASETQLAAKRYRREGGRNGIAEFWLQGFSRDYLDTLEDEVEELDRASEGRHT